MRNRTRLPAHLNAWLRASLLLLVAVSASCTAQDSVTSGAVQHPQPERIATDLTSALEVRGDGHVLDRAAETLVKSLSGGNVIWRRGLDLSVAQTGVFQRFDASVDNGSVFVLNPVSGEVTVERVQGNVAPIRLAPPEAGEGRSVLAGLEVDPSGRLWVTDLSGHLHYAAPSGEGWAWEDRIEWDFFPRGVCATESGLLIPVASDSLSYAVRRLPYQTHDSQVGFGAVYRSSNRLVRDRMRRGLIACDPSSSLVLRAFDMQNRFEVYDSKAGALKWHAILVDLPVPKLLEERDGGVRYGVFDDPYLLFLARAVALESGLFLIQYGQVQNASFRSGSGVYTLRSFLIDGQGERVTDLGTSLPEVVRVAGDLALVVRRSSGEATLELTRLKRSPEDIRSETGAPSYSPAGDDS